MRGLLFFFLSFFGVLFFTVAALFRSGFFELWVFLELVRLCLIPSFFTARSCGLSESLFNYLIFSSISSSFMVVGFLCEDYFYLVVLGLLVKFGVFPFSGWVYCVVCKSNWSLVWLLSTFMKAPFFIVFSFFCSGYDKILFHALFFLSFIVFSLSFWLVRFKWFYLWCTMMLSSRVSIICMSLVISSDLLFWVFIVYAFWSSLVILFFCDQTGLSLHPLSSFFYCSLLLSFPPSIAIFYKFVLGFCIFSCPFPVFLSWVFYNISEQIFFVKYFVSFYIPRDGLRFFLFV